MITCPFCGKTHDNSKHPYLNIVCSCNSKYYANTDEWLNRNTGEKKASVTLGFWTLSNEFMIGEYSSSSTGVRTAEFILKKEPSPSGFKVHIPKKAFKLVLDPKLEKLWLMPQNINTMRDMESYLISIGLVKFN